MPNDADSIRTVRILETDHAILHSKVSPKHSASKLLTKIFTDYLAGKLIVQKPAVRKTTVWVEPELWARVLEKVKQDGVTTTLVISAGIARLKSKARK